MASKPTTPTGWSPNALHLSGCASALAPLCRPLVRSSPSGSEKTQIGATRQTAARSVIVGKLVVSRSATTGQGRCTRAHAICLSGLAGKRLHRLQRAVAVAPRRIAQVASASDPVCERVRECVCVWALDRRFVHFVYVTSSDAAGGGREAHESKQVPTTTRSLPSASTTTTEKTCEYMSVCMRACLHPCMPTCGQVCFDTYDKTRMTRMLTGMLDI